MVRFVGRLGKETALGSSPHHSEHRMAGWRAWPVLASCLLCVAATAAVILFPVSCHRAERPVMPDPADLLVSEETSPAIAQQISPLLPIDPVGAQDAPKPGICTSQFALGPEINGL